MTTHEATFSPRATNDRSLVVRVPGLLPDCFYLKDERGQVMIGRDAERAGEANFVHLQDPRVSRQHALMTWTEEEIKLQDLSSKTGTFAWGYRIKGKYTCLDGELIQFGDSTVKVHFPQRRNHSLVTGERSTAPWFLEAQRLSQELSCLVNFPAIVADRLMVNFYKNIRKLAESNASIFIGGETGVGKELIARALHAWSPRAQGPFGGLNCGAFSETLLESELFGHERGSFSGATRMHRGVFERASGGTVFLDEVADLPIRARAMLLRVLQERKLTRVGGEADIHVDIRIISASKTDLLDSMRCRLFPEDLGYRLVVGHLIVPPLRERRSEIMPIALAYIDNFSKEQKKEMLTIAPQALELLTEFDWPGNLRQLRNFAELLVAVNSSNIISPATVATQLGQFKNRNIEAMEEIIKNSIPSQRITGELGGKRQGIKNEVYEEERRRFLEIIESSNSMEEAISKSGYPKSTFYYRAKILKIQCPEQYLGRQTADPHG